jgi:hypothetical protein
LTRENRRKLLTKQWYLFTYFVFVYPNQRKEQVKYIDKGEQEKTIYEVLIFINWFCVCISKTVKRTDKIYWQRRKRHKVHIMQNSSKFFFWFIYVPFDRPWKVGYKYMIFKPIGLFFGKKNPRNSGVVKNSSK